MNTPCPVCAAPLAEFRDFALRDLFVMDGGSESFGLQKCRECGLALTTPPLSDEALGRYYPPDFESFVVKRSLSQLIFELQFLRDIKKIRKFSGRSEISLYEVGAGRGAFLAVAKKSGISVDGIEPGAQGVKVAKEVYGIDLAKGFASDVHFSRKYDVVAMRHVLEHVNEFRETLRNVFEAGLGEGGVLFLKLPCPESWEARLFGEFWHGWDAPRHRVHFSPKSIATLLTQLGFVDVVVKREVVPFDALRSLKYHASHGNRARWASRAFQRFPYVLQFALATLLTFLLSPAGPGRMIVMARKRSRDESLRG